MAITVTKVQIPEGIQTKLVTIALDSAYPTGGYTIVPSDVGLSTVILSLTCNSSGGYAYEWTGSKLKMYCETASGTAALAQVGNGVDVSAVTALTAVVRGY